MSKSVPPQRNIPSIDRLLQSAAGRSLITRFGRELSLQAYRHATSVVRKSLSDDAGVSFESDNKSIEDSIESALHDHAEQWSDDLMSPSLKPVFNLTGTVLHTNLGRAPLPEECIDAIVAVSRTASNLEYSLDKGRRGDRDSHIEAWLCRLTGAEAATVVNNNAAAVLLSLNSLAARRSVAVSRGELVEIGGSFRIPDIMKRAGCKLIEVGTTNRTHREDYLQAIEEGASSLMRVHTSNYKIEGFASQVSDSALGKLARESGVTYINDLGSGALIDMTRFGLPAEITPSEALAAGAHVVTFSGDKLLGGPQCGLIVGDKQSINRIKKNPMKRALRCDKMTLAALEVLLRMYADPDQLCKRVPSLRLLTRSGEEIMIVANTVLPVLEKMLDGVATISVAASRSQIGSGALPIDRLDSYALVIRPQATSGRALEKLSREFRQLPVPVIGRINDGALWFDMRCVENAGDFSANLANLLCN